MLSRSDQDCAKLLGTKQFFDKEECRRNAATRCFATNFEGASLQKSLQLAFRLSGHRWRNIAIKRERFTGAKLNQEYRILTIVGWPALDHVPTSVGYLTLNTRVAGVRQRLRHTNYTCTAHLTEDLVMMKQPAENLNATREEVEATLARVEPICPDSPELTEEVAKLAYQFWRELKGLGGSPENDWFRA
jgi:hypothetical protein